ncbi:GAF and ANTAR domain-containing protein [Microbacterium mangrovi]|uniref:GAF and ANTAR domain-containing protein n=1 Tax=Microbacterium mangrovi TaxID=1348253 RepID=UPI00068EDB23|nr:GAF and ANTAR domain-containing protein [Microbacterium mangrovi]
MTDILREAQLFQTFAKLADTLVDDYDVVELLQSLVDSCRDLLSTTSAAGILLADTDGELELVASTSEGTRLVETMQLGAQAGPCIESFRTGTAVSVPSIQDSPPEWAAFRESALTLGFASAEAIPLRLRDVTIGTLNLLRSESGAASETDLLAAQAFADVATIGILHERTLRESEVLAQQLQAALNHRVVIEQAKGVVSYTNNVLIDEAFEMIRDYSRRHGLPITEVAGRIVRRELHLPSPRNTGSGHSQQS